MRIKTKAQAFLIAGIIVSILGLVGTSSGQRVFSIGGGILLLVGGILLANYRRLLPSIGFEGKVKLRFSGYDLCQEIELQTRGDKDNPSEIARRKLERIIEQKKQQAKRDIRTSFLGIKLPSRIISRSGLFLSIPYEERSLEELERILEDVDEIYSDYDLYDFFEENSQKINICVINEGSAYIEDASIRIEIAKVEGLCVPGRIFAEPSGGFPNIPRLDFLRDTRYPSVEESDSLYIISELIGNIKHHLPIDVFEEPLRIVLLDKLIGSVIDLKCTLFGKNLAEPLRETLRIRAIPPQDKKES